MEKLYWKFTKSQFLSPLLILHPQVYPSLKSLKGILYHKANKNPTMQSLLLSLVEPDHVTFSLLITPV